MVLLVTEKGVWCEGTYTTLKEFDNTPPEPTEEKSTTKKQEKQQATPPPSTPSSVLQCKEPDYKYVIIKENGKTVGEYFDYPTTTWEEFLIALKKQFKIASGENSQQQQHIELVSSKGARVTELKHLQPWDTIYLVKDNEEWQDPEQLRVIIQGPQGAAILKKLLR